MNASLVKIATGAGKQIAVFVAKEVVVRTQEYVAENYDDIVYNIGYRINQGYNCVINYLYPPPPKRRRRRKSKGLK